MRTFISDVPLSLVAVGAAVLIALVLSPATARMLQTQRSIAALLLIGTGFVLAATLVPTAAALEGATSDGICTFSRIGLARIGQLTSVTPTSLNVLLFVPLGFAVGLLPRWRTTVVVMLGAILLPFVVETIQLVVTALARDCESADIVDNLLGLTIGFAFGIVARQLLAVRPGLRE